MIIEDKFKEYCGLFGVYGGDLPAKSIYYGLFALQHRGQESAGIAVSDGEVIRHHNGMGLVNQVFHNEKNIRKLYGKLGIGHVRYSTTGSSVLENAQPIVIDTCYGTIALAHNGNLINSADLRQELMLKGISFAGTSDSEVIASLISTSTKDNLEDALVDILKLCKGAFSLLIMTKDKIIGIRDPHGIRPLCVGRNEESYIVASETCALDILGATFLRDVANGEMVIIDQGGLSSKTWDNGNRESLCVFEMIYFARPDSVIHGRSVYEARVQMGKCLAQEHPVEADMVIAVPDSGIPAAIGYAAESGIPYGEGLVKNRYVGRTFIQPSQAIREMGVKIKLNPLRDTLRGKKIIIIDDSIVRGTTSRQMIGLLKDAGARETHMRVSSPPINYSCFYGIDTPTRAELVSANLSVEGIRRYLDADSLGYLSLGSLVKSVGLGKRGLCLACLNGEYPLKIPECLSSLKLIFK